MSTVSSDPLFRPLAEPIVPSLTVADLAAMPDELPSGPVKYELDNGRLIMSPPPGSSHGSLQLSIGAAILEFATQNNLGRVWTETGVVLWRKPDRCVGPDVSFVLKKKLPVKLSHEGYLETIPDLVVEVRSKNDTVAYLDRKVADYLKAGVQLVWIVDPASKTVVEHRAESAPRSLTESDSLQCEDILSGFRLPLGQIFKDL